MRFTSSAITSASGRGSSRRCRPWWPTVIFRRWKPRSTQLRRRREFVAVEEGEAEGGVHGHLLRAPPSRRQHGWPRIWPFRSHSARSMAAMAWLA
jgi:hypothetical protein